MRLIESLRPVFPETAIPADEPLASAATTLEAVRRSRRRLAEEGPEILAMLEAVVSDATSLKPGGDPRAGQDVAARLEAIMHRVEALYGSFEALDEWLKDPRGEPPQ